MKYTAYFVALEGFEPSLKVPETCVLPLHHKAIHNVCLKRRCKITTSFLFHQILMLFFVKKVVNLHL